MELLKRLLKQKGLHQAVMFHDVRWGAEHEGRFLWVLLNSGSCGAYAFNHDPEYAPRRALVPAALALLPHPGRHLRRREPARCDDVGTRLHQGGCAVDGCRQRRGGEAAPRGARRWWEGTTRQWPFMAADMGISQQTLMAHYLSNHVAVAYGDVFEEMVALSLELGFKVRVLGKQHQPARRVDETA